MDLQKTGQLQLFDYDSLDSETRIIVQQRTGEIKDLVRTTAESASQIGERLTDVRARLANGRFEAWLEAEFHWSRRTAYNFIGVWEKFRGVDFSKVSIAASALYLLSAPSAPPKARQDAIEQANSGQSVTFSDAKEMIKRHRPRQRRLKTTLEERLTPCDCCQWPISTRAHLLPVSEYGDINLTVQLCRNCHELYDIIAKVLNQGENGAGRADRLLESINGYWGNKHPAIVYLTNKAQRVHQARQILEGERDERITA